MNYRLKAVLDAFKILQNYERKWYPSLRKPLDPKALAKGLSVSKMVCKQPETVVATPLMKNLLIMEGDVKVIRRKDGTTETTKLGVGVESKAVDWINRVTHAALVKFNGPEKHDYSLETDPASKILYDTDCWNGWKQQPWDIVPGMEDMIEESLDPYFSKETNMSDDIMFQRLTKDPVLQLVVLSVMAELPSVKAVREIRAISMAFQQKGTGVSWPYFANDRKLVDDKGLTYGELCMQDAERALNAGEISMEEFVLLNNIYTLYTRLQRGKARALEAQSRRVNLIINMVNGPEMEAWKDIKSLNLGFVSEAILGERMTEMYDQMVKFTLNAANIDYSGWDRNLGKGWVTLQNAIRFALAPDAFTRKLIALRHFCTVHSRIVNGLSQKCQEIYGRMESGFLDTTLGNTTAQKLQSRYNLALQDKKHSMVISQLKGCDTNCLGDDLLALGHGDFVSNFAKVAKKYCGSIVHEDEKHATGLMFVQYRWFKLAGKPVIAYNWPRVLRSMLSKESAKQLGRGGWTLSFYQQLGKLGQVPEALSIVTNIAAALDTRGLLLNTPVEEILKMVQEEDKQAMEGNGQKRTGMQTTAERLYNSNPNIPGVIIRDNGTVELDGNYFKDIQARIRKVYNPDFLPKVLGIPNPDTNKIPVDKR